MKHTGHLFKDKSLKVMLLSIIAGYSGHAFTADLVKGNTKEETLGQCHCLPGERG